MENTTNKKKSWLPILLGAVGLIVVLMIGVVLWKTVFTSPYQKWLAEAKSCVKDQLGVQTIYTKEISPELLEYYSTSTPLTTSFLMVALAKSEKGMPRHITDKVSQEFWANFQFDCDFSPRGIRMTSNFFKAVLAEVAKEVSTRKKPLFLLDTYNEGTEHFEDDAYEKKIKSSRKALPKKK